MLPRSSRSSEEENNGKYILRALGILMWLLLHLVPLATGIYLHSRLLAHIKPSDMLVRPPKPSYYWPAAWATMCVWTGITLTSSWLLLWYVSYKRRSSNNPEQDLRPKAVHLIRRNRFETTSLYTRETFSRWCGNMLELLRFVGQSIRYFILEHQIQIQCFAYGILVMYCCIVVDDTYKIIGPEHYNWEKRFHLISEIASAVVIASVVSLMFDVTYHKKMFGRYVENIREDVLTLNNILGFNDLDRHIQEAYRTAQRRIISISDFWSIDAQWWEDGDWHKTPLFESLTADDSEPELIIFAGRVPWVLPTFEEEDAQQILKRIADKDKETIKANCYASEHTSKENADFSKLDTCDVRMRRENFQRLLGVAWRLVIAHKVRKRRGWTSHENSLRVVVAALPFAATVVDDKVFLLLSNELGIDKVHGTQLTGRQDAHNSTRSDKEIADAYCDLICNYLGHVRSAREYILAVFTSAAMADRSINEDTDVLDHITPVLNILGYEDWKQWIEGKMSPQLTRNLEERVKIIFQEFFKTLPDHVKHSPDEASGLDFTNLRESLL